MKREAAIPAIITTGRTIKKTVTFGGKIYQLYLHMKVYTYPHCTFELVDKVTNEEGKELRGLWKWGTYGRCHIESLEFETRSESKNYLGFCTTGHWCNGRAKNGRKVLVDILTIETED